MKTRKRLMAVGFLTGLAILGAVVQAQAPAGVAAGKNYTKKSEFKLPVKFDANQRARLSEVQLYVKQGPSDTWKLNQKAAANSSELSATGGFKFKAPCDGEYWFNVVTVDHAGKMTPPDVGKEQPALMVVVDTQAPECEVRPALTPAGELLFQCDIRDANPDMTKTKLEFLTADRQWQALEPHPTQPGFFRIDPVLMKGMVRATVCDRSGNCTVREFNMAAMTTMSSSTASKPINPALTPASMVQPLIATPASAVTPMTMPAQPAVAAPSPTPMISPAPAPVLSPAPAMPAPVAAPVQPTPAPVAAPVAPQTHVVPAPVTQPQPMMTTMTMPVQTPSTMATPVANVTPVHTVNSVASPASPTIQTVACTNPATSAPCRTSMSPPLQMVNCRRVALDYQVDQMGPSGVGKVEVWITCDECQTWQKLCEDADRRSPVEFDLPGEGTYGVSLVLSSGSGIEGAPPARGDSPDWWVEVDGTRPVAQLLAVRPCSKEDMGNYLITWTASDKNLKAEPVDLYYALHKEGPWQPIAKAVRNDGNYRWALPPGLQGEIFVRLEVTDKAGNITHCEASQGSFMDLSRPKARVIGITAPMPRMAPAGN